MKILVLLSGGLDSAVVLASLVKEHECSALAFSYGQKHQIELEYAERLAKRYSVPFEIVELPPMPLVDDVMFAGRNLVLAAHAVAHAQAGGFDAIAVGCNESDWARFPDCRPEFWSSLKRACDAYGVQVFTPLLRMWKGQVVALAKDIAVPIEMTWSCYSPMTHWGAPRQSVPCGVCLACTTRKDALECQPCS